VKSHDVHSFSNPADHRVTHAHLDIDVSFDRRELVCIAVLTVRSQLDAHGLLILDTRDLSIRSVEVSRDGNTFVHRAHELGPRDRILGSPLRIPLKSDEPYVRITYSTAPHATGLQWLDPAQTASGDPFLFTQSQEIHARSWLPIQDTPAVRLTFSATVRTPPGSAAVMGADRLDWSRSGRTFRFQMDQPVPAYLIALAVGTLEFCETGPRSGVFAEPPLLSAAAWEFADTEPMLKAIEELYGPYRWGRFDLLVLPPSFPFGGMEIPKLTFVSPTLIAGDRSLVSLVVHEIAHSWSGNLVTNATWSDFWLNEGFTTYIEHRIFRQLYGSRRADMEEVLQFQRLKEELVDLRPADQILYINLDGRDPDDGSTLVPYEKGALLLHFLEAAVGRERFDQFLSDYFRDLAFKSVTTAEVIEYLSAKILDGRPDLIRSLQEWIFEPGLPEATPAVSSDALETIEDHAARWIGGSVRLEDIGIRDWNSYELIHFLDSLSAPVDFEKLQALDRATGLTSCTNNEVLQRWLLIAIRNRYHLAYGAVERFLCTVGRRKYVKALYEELTKSRDLRELAQAIYAKARPQYHPITQASIDDVMRRAFEPQTVDGGR
jgi:leukotriene-A4 hydrolase